MTMKLTGIAALYVVCCLASFGAADGGEEQALLKSAAAKIEAGTFSRQEASACERYSRTSKTNRDKFRLLLASYQRRVLGYPARSLDIVAPEVFAPADYADWKKRNAAAHAERLKVYNRDLAAWKLVRARDPHGVQAPPQLPPDILVDLPSADKWRIDQANVLFAVEGVNCLCEVGRYQEALQVIDRVGKGADTVGRIHASESAGDLAVEGGAMVLKGDTAAVGSGTPTVKHGVGYRIEAANVVVAGSGALHADGCGFPYSQGPGEGSGPDNGRGAGYGGRGGDGSNPALWYAGVVYGTNLMPSALGSGGGHDYASDPLSGSGGGALWVVATGDVTIDGRLSSDGAPSRGTWASGASGGSLLVSAERIQGGGMIAARGGSVPAVATAGGGGDCGRVCLVFGDTPGIRQNILEGDMVRARIVDALPLFGGAVSVAPGTGFYNDEAQGAKAGTLVYIRALPPPGTIIIVR